MEQKEKINEDIKYLIRRVKETTNLIKDAKYVDAYHKSLGINQKLADLQGRLESGDLEICEKNCSTKDFSNGKITSENGRVIKYGDKQVEKTG